MARGTLLSIIGILLPGVLLERSFVRSEDAIEAAFLAFLLGMVSVSTTAVSLAFILSTVVSVPVLLAAAILVVALTYTTSNKSFMGSAPTLQYDPARCMSLLVVLLLIIGAYWHVYDTSTPRIHAMCSMQPLTYLLGLPDRRCRLNSEMLAMLTPVSALPEDMIIVCPEESSCRYLARHHPRDLQEALERGETVKFSKPTYPQLGYSILITPWARYLKFFGVHVFYFLIRGLALTGLYLIVRRITSGHVVALIVAATVMSDPLASYVHRHNENLCALSLLLGFLLLLLNTRGSGKKALTAGLLLGAILGVRHILGISVPAIVLYILTMRPRGQRATPLILLAIGTFAMLLPYMYWHQSLFGDLFTNELAYQEELWENTFPILNLKFSTRIPLSWPFHDQLARPAELAFPTMVHLVLTLFRMFGIILSAVGIFGLASVAMHDRPLTLLLVLWFVPAFIIMGLDSKWSASKRSYIYLVVAPPAACVGFGLDRLLRQRNKHHIVIVVVTTLLIMTLLRSLAGVSIPPDSRFTGPSLSTFMDPAQVRAEWTDLRLLPDGAWALPSPSRLDETAQSGRTLSIWSDVLTYNLDRNEPYSCLDFLGDGVGWTDLENAIVRIPQDPSPPISSIILNRDSIRAWSDLLARNQRHNFFPPFDILEPPPDMMLIQSLSKTTPQAIENTLSAIMTEGLPSSPLLIVLGEASASPELAQGVLGHLSPVPLPTGQGVPASARPTGGLISRPDAIRGRIHPDIVPGSEVVWRYDDDVPLLVRQEIRRRDIWFLNAHLDRDDPEGAATVLNEALARIKGTPLRIGLDVDGRTLHIDVSMEVNSALPTYTTPSVSVVPSNQPKRGRKGLIFIAPIGTDTVRITVDGSLAHTMHISSGQHDISTYDLMSGPVQVGILTIIPEGPQTQRLLGSGQV